MLLKIRTENPFDFRAITEVNDLSFGQPNEGKLIGKLRKRPEFILKLSLMVMELKEGALEGATGFAEYPEEFNDV